ncbi:hypothetical protein A2164_03655 [Candidatus Curtissbacteria bacterium RBG_13_35_7]|uniref:Uncharacterized protein n=1 Tax=Candidatus Curtissbacteria bacterium RBG_13_35_7 TaxID=1797705 RepID=A0A1F5G3S8_9BACT|nr:MAG: hypothetical protein A2164_03655 [Candidatus Curtissbacteria bacterium RBG_13_35_7]
MLNKNIKFDKKLYFNIAFVIALIIFTYVVFHLSVGWFTVVMPIFAGLIFLAIFLLPDDEKN